MKLQVMRCLVYVYLELLLKHRSRVIGMLGLIPVLDGYIFGVGVGDATKL